jgi:hypothetical protein
MTLGGKGDLPDNIPGYWMNETSGVLVPAVQAYLNNQPMTDRQIAAMRAYFRQWMNADWKGPMIDPLRTKVNEIATREDITAWLDMALSENIDPI